jgi:hypothetical protein
MIKVTSNNITGLTKKQFILFKEFGIIGASVFDEEIATAVKAYLLEELLKKHRPELLK